MKKNLLFAASFLASAVTVLGQATGTRQLMFEHFTQASCGPCASQNPSFNALLAANADKVNAIKYQVSWPGYDPMYEHNPLEVDARVAYYNVTGVPNVLRNGGSQGSPSSHTQAQIDADAAVPAPVEVGVSYQWSADLSSIDITVDITNTNGANDFTLADVLQVGIVEEEIIFATAPGSNGEKEFFKVMKKMVNGSDGNALGTIASGATVTKTFTVPVPGYSYKLAEIGVVAWVQNSSTKEIYNSGYQGPVALPGGLTAADLSVKSATPALTGLCDYALNPAVIVTNAGASEVASFDVSYQIDGGAWVTKSTTEALPVGSSVTVTFDQTTLSGSATVNYEVSNLNAGSSYDESPVNNWVPAEKFGVLSTASYATNAQQGFEIEGAGSKTQDIDNVIFNGGAVDAGDFCSLNRPSMGGFAESNSAIYAFLYPYKGRKMELVIDKLDFTDNAYPVLEFDYSYAQLTDQKDRLEVMVSKDCGANWTTVFDRSGDDLTTQPDDDRYIAYPTEASEWATTMVELNDFANTDEVVIKFVITSDGGNSMYLDNVETRESGVGVKEVADNGISVMPNPASSVVKVAFNADNNEAYGITIVNSFGQIVKNVAADNYSTAGVVEINVADLATGVYFVNIVSENGKKFSEKLMKF